MQETLIADESAAPPISVNRSKRMAQAVPPTKDGVFISTYGCQMNVNDTERMYSLLEMNNFIPVDQPEKASIIIINSCSIREKPVHKVYSEVGTYRRMKAKNPELLIGVGGCVGQQEKENLIKTQPMIDFVFGTDSIDMLPEIVTKALLRRKNEEDAQLSKKIVESRFKHRDPYHIETMIRNPGVSTFVNITKGCDNFCSFCVVPFTRGREKSRPYRHVLEDVNGLIRRGVKEVTFLGQNVNSYESECGVDFANLLEKIATETEIQRIRFTTSHPKDFDEKLVAVMSKHKEKICDYIHLPFQSGSTKILARMNRNYTRDEYLQKIEMIKKGFPNVVLSTDIIVGFPGETEQDFQDTLDMVKEVGFETIFAFKYSPRPNTKAAQFEDQIPDDIQSERLSRLFAQHEKMSLALVKQYEGKVLQVLVEKKVDSLDTIPKFSGRSTQNKLVYFNAQAEEKDMVGRAVDVKITKAFPATFRGDFLGETK